MRIRTKILLSHTVMAVTVALVCLAIVAALLIAERNQRHLEASYEQIRAINLIAARANDYSEQVAELFILGPELTAEVEEARGKLFAALDRKERLVEEELGFMHDPAERAGEMEELERVEAMRGTVRELDGKRPEIQRLLVAGRRDEAEAFYHDQVEHRLDHALGALIETAMTNERSEVEEALEQSHRLSRRSIALVASVVGIVGLIGIANAIVLNRTISRPVAALAAAADAVGGGDFGHVIGHTGSDELGNLAARFDLMTGQIREQRDKLMEAKATLAQQVDERTRQLKERGEELEAAVARLRELDSARAQFLADISHELRTPLTILRGQAEVALRNRDAGFDELRQTLALVARKAGQMSRLVEDLLFLARTEAGAIPVVLAPVVLQDVVADVLLDSQALSRRDGVTISPRQPAEPVIVRADADRLRQAILIVLDNAVKHAPAGSTVELQLVPGDRQVAIRVRDAGPGFTPDEASDAFTRFYRGRASRGPSRGTGLGLSIARWIVDRHKGSITIESAPGKGALVAIALPRLQAAA